jgi:hypothetical protein
MRADHTRPSRPIIELTAPEPPTAIATKTGAVVDDDVFPLAPAVRPDDFVAVASDLRRQVKQAFQTGGIELAIPGLLRSPRQPGSQTGP